MLAAVLLPALARAREAARRGSCANNLKQWGLILKMYSGENKGGALPPGSQYLPSDNSGGVLLSYRGIAANLLYPDYWTDPNIWICPSDSRTTVGSWHTDWGNLFIEVDEDYAGQIRTIGENPHPLAKAWLYMMLSVNPSYVYLPWCMRTNGQLVQALVCQQFAWAPHGWNDIRGWHPGSSTTPWGSDSGIMYSVGWDYDMGSAGDVMIQGMNHFYSTFGAPPAVAWPGNRHQSARHPSYQWRRASPGCRAYSFHE